MSIPSEPDNNSFSIGNTNPPGSYNLGPAVVSVQNAVNSIGSVSKSVNTKVSNAAKRASTAISSVVGVLGQSSANAAGQATGQIQSVMGDVLTSAMMQAAGAAEAIGAAVGVPHPDPVPGVDCSDGDYLACVCSWIQIEAQRNICFLAVTGQVVDLPTIMAKIKAEVSALGSCQQIFAQNAVGVTPFDVCWGNEVTRWNQIGLSGGYCSGPGQPPDPGSLFDYITQCYNPPTGGGQPPGGGGQPPVNGGQPPPGNGGQPQPPPGNGGQPQPPPGTGPGGPGGPGGQPPGQPQPPPTQPPVIPPGGGQPPPVYVGTPVYPPGTGPGSPPPGTGPGNPPYPPGTGPVYPGAPSAGNLPPGQCATTCIPSRTSEQPPAVPPNQQWYGVCCSDGTALATQDTSKYEADPTCWISQGYDNQGTAYQAAFQTCRDRSQLQQPPRQPPKLPSFNVPPSLTAIKSICDLQTLTSGSGSQQIGQGFTGGGWIDAINSATQTVVNRVYDGISSLPIAGSIVESIKRFLVADYDTTASISPIILRMLGCDNPNSEQLVSFLAMLGYWEKKSNVDFSSWKQHVQYVFNAQCPNIQLSPSDAVTAYLANAINPDDFGRYGLIAGLCPGTINLMAEASRSKIGPTELAILNRRKVILPQDYANGIREAGYTKDTDAANLLALTEQRPGIGEILLAASRNVGDEEQANNLGLDDNFSTVFNSTLNKWIDDTGLTDDQVKYAWRSHWRPLDTGTLFTLFHRLRRNPDFGTQDEQQAKIKQEMIRNDITPSNTDSLVAIQYNPISVRYIQRLHNIGELDSQGINDSFASLGYSDSDCDSLTAATIALKMQQGEHLAFIQQWLDFAIDGTELDKRLDNYGYTTDQITTLKQDAEAKFDRSTYAKAFTEGTISIQSLRQKLSDQGVSDEGISRIVERLSLTVKSVPELDDYKIGILSSDDTRQALTLYGVDDSRSTQLLQAIDDSFKRERINTCIKAIERRYTTGDYDQTTALDQLIKTGLVSERANQLIDDWQCLLAANGKIVPATELCRWYGQGLINSDELISRLDKIGYDHDDSLKIYAACQAGIDQKQQQQLIREQQQRERAAKQAAQSAQRLATQVQRQAAAAEKARQASLRAKKNRDAQILVVTNKVEKESTADYMTSISAVQDMLSELKTTYHFGLDEAIEIMTKTTDGWTGFAIDDWQTRIRMNAELIIQEATPADSNTLVSSSDV